MLRRAVSTEGKGWDKLIPCLLLYQKVWRASTGFAVFELLYGRQVWGPLDVLKQTWEANRWSGESVSVICLGSAGEDGYNGRAGEEQSGQVPEGAETVVRPGRRPGASAIAGSVAGTVSSVA